MEEKIYGMLDEINTDNDYKASEDFVEDGLLDSFDVISLVNMIEDEFNIVIDGLDIIPENFTSVELIIELIKKSGGNL